MHSWFAQSGSRPCPWSASRRATLERRSLEGWIYAGPPCRRNAVQYDPGSASIGDLLGRLRSYSKLREGRLRGHHTKREKSHANPSLQLSQVRFGIKREYFGPTKTTFSMILYKPMPAIMMPRTSKTQPVRKTSATKSASPLALSGSEAK
jgi:hypothetical protein